METPAGLLVRPARIEDHPGICELAAEMDRLHRDALPDRFRLPDGPSRAREHVSGLIADEDTCLLVAELGGRLVGIINTCRRRTPAIPVKRPRRYLQVRGIVVAPDQRRRGIGSALLARARAWAAGNGAQEVQLEVYAFNSAAAAFFRRHGFTPLSRRYILPLDPGAR